MTVMPAYAILRKDAEGNVVASLLGWPGVIAQGKSEAEAIESLRHSIGHLIGDAEIIGLEVAADKPWLATAGMFRDDPFAEEFSALLDQYRRERNADEAQYARLRANPWPCD